MMKQVTKNRISTGSGAFALSGLAGLFLDGSNMGALAGGIIICLSGMIWAYNSSPKTVIAHRTEQGNWMPNKQISAGANTRFGTHKAITLMAVIAGLGTPITLGSIDKNHNTMRISTASSAPAPISKPF